MLNAHYLNTTLEELTPEVSVSLHGISEDEYVEGGGFLFWYNVFIRLPPGETSHAKMSCDVVDDVRLISAQSHMHRNGVDFRAHLVSPDGERQEIYQSSYWQDVMIRTWKDGLLLPAGSRIEYECTYENDTKDEIMQGPTADHEMCMLVGTIYPSSPMTSLCARDEARQVPTRWYGATWYGNGNLT